MEATVSTPIEPTADHPRQISWRVDDKDVGDPDFPESVRNQSVKTYNPTKAWFFYPFVPDIHGLTAVGLPRDMFHAASCWQPHQVEQRTRQDNILITPIDAHGMKIRGSPYVHIKPPTDAIWDRILGLWTPILAQEYEIELDMLEQAERDIERTLTREDRASMRNQIRVMSKRVKQLKRGVDFDKVRRFFNEEAEWSSAVARQARTTVKSEVNSAMDKWFDEHEDSAPGQSQIEMGIG